MSNEKELIWVEKSFADKYKKIEDDNAKIKLLEEYLEGVKKSVKDDYKSSLEAMEEDAVMYQGLYLKTKQRFGELKDEALSALYEMWEKFDKEKSDVVKKITSITTTIEPLKAEINGINETLNKIHTWDFERLIETLSKVNGLTGESKSVLEFLIKNFKQG